MPALVLASTSPYRKALLERLQLPFDCVPPEVDEAAAKQQPLAPEALAAQLARSKAVAVAGLRPDAVVVGCDQVAALGDTVLDKPGSDGRAVEQLLALQGREHRLVTAVAVAHGRQLVAFADVTWLRMRGLDRAACERYVAADRPLDCAGSYRIEALGIALFEQIRSADHTAIVGLPLLRLARTLREFGFELP